MDAQTPTQNANERHGTTPKPSQALQLTRETLATLDPRPAHAGLRLPLLTGKCVTFNVGAIRPRDVA